MDTGTGDSGDVEARCFRTCREELGYRLAWRNVTDYLDLEIERDSPKSHFLVVLFIIITASLLGGATLRHVGVDLQAIWHRGGIRDILSVS